ncbi:MAG: glycosyltransferase family 39 protein [Planctomycetota bacterium]
MRGRYLGFAVGVVLLAFLARAWHASARAGLWRDEANAFFVVRESSSLEELFRNLRVESTPPLEPLLEYGLQRTVGTDPAWLRALAVLFGTLTVAGIVVLGWRSFHPVCGILAGLIAATSPYFIRLSGEMRSYALYGFVAVVHTAFYLRYVERRRLLDGCLWGASAALLAYTHYYAFPIVLCAGVAALVFARRRADVIHVVAAGAVFLALYAPWLATLLHQLGADLQPWYPPSTSAYGLFSVLKLPLGSTGAILLGSSLLVGAWTLRPRTPAGVAESPEHLRFWALLAVSVVPAALAWLLQVYMGAFEGRYLMAMVVPLLPAACLRWSDMFRGEPVSFALPWPRRTLAISGATWRLAAWALLAAAISCQHLERAKWLRRSSPGAEFAELVERNARPDDLIWIFPAPYASTFNYHFHGPQEQLAFPFRGRVTRVDWPALRDNEQDPRLIDAFLLELERHLEGGGRVWGLFVEGLPMDKGWPLGEGPSPAEASRLARAELQVHRRALRILYTHGAVAGWWDRPHHDYHEGMTLVLFDPQPDPATARDAEGLGPAQGSRFGDGAD